jgi:uncharacterized damage-inducible protein DinB
MNEVERIAYQINFAYQNGFWGGGSIRELLRSIETSDAASYPISTAHSIWEIVLHLSVWHTIFRSRIVKEEIEYFYETDWPIPDATDQNNWKKSLDELDNSNKELVAAVRKVNVEDLNLLVSGKKFTIYEMLHGIPQHDQYHAGQVKILKKAILNKKGFA